MCTAASASAREGRGWSERTAAARNPDGSSSAGRTSALASEGFRSEGLLGRSGLINASMSTPFDRPCVRPECHRADGAVCRRTPESHINNTTAAELVLFRDAEETTGLYFRHFPPSIV